MALACNTAAVVVSLDASVRPAVVALPAQVITLEALLHTPEKAAQPDAGGKGAQVRGGTLPLPDCCCLAVACCCLEAF